MKINLSNVIQGLILVVICVVAVALFNLTAEVVPIKSEINKQTKNNIMTIRTALRLYKMDNFIYPRTEQGLNALIKKPVIAPVPKNYKEGGYLKVIPKDEWGNDFIYIHPYDKGSSKILIKSLGKDGALGGDGINADISG